MPKREDIKSIFIIGAGPIVIGQACEFDYSGTQACKSLRSLGYHVILLNSNPATIMTDPEMADITYIEPLTVEFAEQIIKRERPDAILPTVGGQTALNLAMDLYHQGILEKYNVELIGANVEAIDVAENRQRFKECMIEHNLPVAPSGIAHNLEEAQDILENVGLPAIIRPSFTLGGEGGGVAYNQDEFREIVSRGLHLSPTTQVLIEKSALGWKEFEFEVMRDVKDNVIIICSIENFDPMGVHTGDSITVAPSQTLTDREYQSLRDLSLAVIRAVGVETGGSNIQFAVHPDTGEYFIIEMNPRVSRSSALASKATGFPIAKIAAQLAVGLTLDEIPNDITRKTPACFEPALDYVVVKIPRWNFEKFPSATNVLGTQMKSVGEVMSLGESFQESLGKAISSLEGGFPFTKDWGSDGISEHLAHPTPMRLPAILEAFRTGWDVSEVHEMTQIDPWFLNEVQDLISKEQKFIATPTVHTYLEVKRAGLSDTLLALGMNKSTTEFEKLRNKWKSVAPVYKRVDTCAAEFESFTPYLYSNYREEDEGGDTTNNSVVILGNGPNRIGQGIEFDYCCCHAAMAVQEAQKKAIMINCNPETVSTDYDTSDKLYFEPITKEHVNNIMKKEKPLGAILQFGGQSPLKLSHDISPILGTDPTAIDICEDRERFNTLMNELNIRQPKGALVYSKEEAYQAAEDIGFPLLVRPSYVLGGRGMNICYDFKGFKKALSTALEVSEKHPVLMDQFLQGAFEYDVDVICDKEDVFVAGIMEHIEEAGIHSGDSSCIVPPIILSKENKEEMKEIAHKIGLRLQVCGLMNIQFAVQNRTVYVIEVNPRASRTIPYISKSLGIPLAKIATHIALGKKLSDFQPDAELPKNKFFIKTPVFPWKRFDIKDIKLGPEMRSTGEVMGIGDTIGEAYAKALIASGCRLPKSGCIFLSFRDQDKYDLPRIGRKLHNLGYKLIATQGTYECLQLHDIPCDRVNKVLQGRPHIVDSIRNGHVHLMINTPSNHNIRSRKDDSSMRIAGLKFDLPCITNLRSAQVLIQALDCLQQGDWSIESIQNLHQIS